MTTGAVTPLRAESGMKPHQVLAIAIPRGRAEQVGALLRKSVATVKSWRRRPESRDDPMATGRSSPLDDFIPFLMAAFVGTEKGEGADVILSYLADIVMEAHVDHGHVKPMSKDERRAKLRVIEEAAADVRRRSRE